MRTSPPQTPQLALTSLLAPSRVAVVDYRGQTVFCSYVLPTNPVTDYRTNTTGIQASDLQPGQTTRALSPSPGADDTLGNALPWKEVQQRVAQLIRDRILVGHTLWQDLSGKSPRHQIPAVVPQR